MSPCLWPSPEWRDMIKYNPLKLGNMFMADKDEASAALALPATAPTVRVLPDIPLLFADGVSVQSYAPGISKFYLIRADPDPSGRDNKLTTVTQVVMPMEGFVQMWAFFEHRIKVMIKAGVVDKKDC